VETAVSDFAFIFFIISLLRSANRCSSVSVATTLHAGRPRNRFSVPVRGTDFLVVYHIETVGRDSSVGISTRYGLNGIGIESQWGEIFGNPPDGP
jgi:hypothetical protein